jgi:hypothetical protein
VKIHQLTEQIMGHESTPNIRYTVLSYDQNGHKRA